MQEKLFLFFIIFKYIYSTKHILCVYWITPSIPSTIKIYLVFLVPLSLLHDTERRLKKKRERDRERENPNKTGKQNTEKEKVIYKSGGTKKKWKEKPPI